MKTFLFYLFCFFFSGFYAFISESTVKRGNEGRKRWEMTCNKGPQLDSDPVTLWFIIGVFLLRPPGHPVNLVFDITYILQRALELVTVNKPLISSLQMLCHTLINIYSNHHAMMFTSRH